MKAVIVDLRLVVEHASGMEHGPGKISEAASVAIAGETLHIGAGRGAGQYVVDSAAITYVAEAIRP